MQASFKERKLYGISQKRGEGVGQGTFKGRLDCDKIIVSDAEEENWLINLLAHGQQAYISSALPFLLQSKKLKLINEYTALAEKGEFARALEVYKRVEPIRTALVKVTPPGKRQATHKYWAQCLGMAGGDGRVRPPYQQLTEAEKEAIKAAVQSSGLI